MDRYDDGISDRVQCLLRQVIMMTKFSEAFNLCQNKFVEEGYKGVGTIYQSKNAWLFCPLFDEPEYGTLPIVFLRNGGELFCFDWNVQSVREYIDNAVVIN